jgi:predicted DsbA family dithiol-disulfide isomerase
VLKEKYHAEIRWHSYELRPAGSPPVSPAYRARIEAMRPQMEAMARDRYGLEINAGPFGISSRPALIGAKFAEAQGQGEAYHDAVFCAYWQEARDIADLDVLGDMATAVNLNKTEFLAALNDPVYEQQVTADIEQAFRFGLSGVPALVFNQKYLVVGAQPLPTLEEVAEKALEEAA